MSYRIPSYGAPRFEPERATSFESAAKSGPATTSTPADMTTVWPFLNEHHRSTISAAAREAARLLIRAVDGLSVRKGIWLTGALVLGLSLLAVGLALSQGGTESSTTRASVAEQDQLTITLVSSLRSELEEAQYRIAKLSLALEVSEQKAEELYADLLVARRALETERNGEQFDTEKTSLNIETNSCQASEQTFYVQARRANVREGPGTDYAILTQVNKGHSLMKLDRRGNWFWMTYEAGETIGAGWIHSSLVSPDCL